MDFEERIYRFAESMADRLATSLLSSATEYVQFGECSLAVEMLCDHLLEYSVNITNSEYEEIADLARITAADPLRIQMLKRLIT